MDISKILAELKQQRQCLEDAIACLERLKDSMRRHPRTPLVSRAGAALPLPVIHADAVSTHLNIEASALKLKPTSLVIVEATQLSEMVLRRSVRQIRS